MRSVSPYSCGCWAVRKEDKVHRERNDWAVLRRICNGKPGRSSIDLHCNGLGIVPLITVLRSRHLSWFGHNDDWINQCFSLDVVGKCGKGRLRETSVNVIQDNLKSWNLIKDNVLDRVIHRHNLAGAATASNPCFKERRR